MDERVHDPYRRQHYQFTADGENLIVDILVARRGAVPSHLHPSQEERWTVVKGRVRFEVAGRRTAPDPGEEIVVPAGVKHSFKNIGPGEAQVRAEVRPALEIEAFLTDAAMLAQAGYYTRHGLPTSLSGARRMAAFLERYKQTAVILWPPRPVQRLLSALLLRNPTPEA
ncbi:MAG: cupin domain-containing protein [Solirubrobacteraceae bacterium]|jgi:quercetin dioxygenase-like cupin family protein